MAHSRLGALRLAFDLVGIDDIDAPAATLRTELSRRRVEPRLIDIPQQNLTAFGDNAARDGEADARRAASDNGAHALKASVCRHRSRLPFARSPLSAAVDAV